MATTQNPQVYAPPSPPASPPASSEPGANVLLVGPTGSGKTHAIRSLISAGITPFCLFTEPGYNAVLGDIPADQLHWHYIAAHNPSWAAMIDSAKKINTLSYESLAKLPGIQKSAYAQFIEVLHTLNNFTCDRTGESFGDISTWSTDRAIVVDSLSGLNIMAMSLVVGSKPTRSQADWGVAMNNLEALVQKLCMDTQCHFVLTAHLEREFDEVTGGVTLMASTLGRKLAPKIPRFFDDVVVCQHTGTEWTWSTSSMNIDLKTRNLEWGDKLPPSFEPLLGHWKSQGGVISPTEDA